MPDAVGGNAGTICVLFLGRGVLSPRISGGEAESCTGEGNRRGGYKGTLCAE